MPKPTPIDSSPTDTSLWTLVILRVTQTSAKLWVGTLDGNLTKPKYAKVEITAPDGSVMVKDIEGYHWKRPFRYIYNRFYQLIEIDGLKPDTHYEVKFLRRIERIKGIPQSIRWQEVRDGKFRTLPSKLSKNEKKPFTIGLGSCFYAHRDGGQAAGAYRALYERGGNETRPDITFLTGDQVYLDIGLDSLSPIKSEIRERVANDYRENWRLLGSIFTRGGTWMLPDDHEFWNDYPFYDSLLPTLFGLKLRYIRRTWTRASEDGVNRVQQSPRLDIFNIGDDLSFCVVDVRSDRHKRGFMSDENFEQLIDWTKNLKSPGVLVISQPIIIYENENERNLLSFEKQYTELVKAMGESEHDIVVLSGDVHYGRISQTKLGKKGKKLIEITSSPLSNLTGLNGLATATPQLEPNKFPDPKAISIPGWVPQKVHHAKKWTVSTRGRFSGGAYPMPRTREHFMTISFNKNENGGVTLKVNAWLVREREGNKNLPKKDFGAIELQLD